MEIWCEDSLPRRPFLSIRELFRVTFHLSEDVRHVQRVGHGVAHEDDQGDHLTSFLNTSIYFNTSFIDQLPIPFI